MKFGAGNAQHIGARSQQQDAFGFCNPGDGAFAEHAGLVGVVADGMGGMARGSEASHAAVRTFLRTYETKARSEPIAHALARALAAANAAVVALNRTDRPADDAGTTLAAAILHQNGLQWIAAGDSRIYLLRDRKLTRITTDHVYARRLNEDVARGAMTRNEMLAHPERSSLTSYLGKRDLSEIDRSLRPMPLQPGDRVIVCTDGLYRALGEDELVEAFRQNLNRACEAVTRMAVRKHRAQQDNLTIIALSHEADSTSYLLPGGSRSLAQPAAIAAGAFVSVVLAGAVAYHERIVIGTQWIRIANAIGARMSPARSTASSPQLPSVSSPGPTASGNRQPSGATDRVTLPPAAKSTPTETAARDQPRDMEASEGSPKRNVETSTETPQVTEPPPPPIPRRQVAPPFAPLPAATSGSGLPRRNRPEGEDGAGADKGRKKFLIFGPRS